MPSTQALTKKWKHAGFILAALSLVIAALALSRWRKTAFHWDQFFATLTAVDWPWLLLGIFLMLVTYLVRAFRWEVMLRPYCPQVDFRALLSATVIGFTAVVVLGRAGELVRPYLIAVKERVPFPSQMAAWVLERILDTMIVLLIFGIALIKIPDRGLHLSVGLEWLVRVGGYIIAVLCAACGFSLVLFRNFTAASRARILSALAFLPEVAYHRIERTLEAFSEGMQSIRSTSSLALLFIYTLIEWSVITAGYYAIFRAFPATSGFGFIDTLTFVGFVSLGSIVQIPGIGGGVQVAIVVVLTELFRLSFEVSSGLALLIWVLGFVSIVPFGLACAFFEGMNWSKFKHLPEDIPT